MSRTKQDLAEISLYDGHGRRKYLTASERKRFREHAETFPPSECNFCLMHFFTGLRISEALEMTVARIDLGEGVVIIRSLKRRKENVFRAVPLPMSYLKSLKRMSAHALPETRLWTFSRKTGYRIIKRVMRDVQISGLHASPKGLRHGFGIACVQQNIPLPTISKWMGHSSINISIGMDKAMVAEIDGFDKVAALKKEKAELDARKQLAASHIKLCVILL